MQCAMLPAPALNDKDCCSIKPNQPHISDAVTSGIEGEASGWFSIRSYDIMIHGLLPLRSTLRAEDALSGKTEGGHSDKDTEQSTDKITTPQWRGD